MSLFPHQKLDWNLARLERRLEEAPDDPGARLELALLHLSRAAFHDAGEPAYNKALTQARRVLQGDPGSVAGNVVAGTALAAMDRLDNARQHLDEAVRLDAESPLVHYARATWHQAARRLGDPQGDRHDPVREAELACRLAPEAWEAHALLSQLLWDRAHELGGPGRSPRMLERSQFHAVRALELGPPLSWQNTLAYHVGITCLHGGRYNEANKLLTPLLEDDRFRHRSQYYLGLVNYHLGKFKNAILYLRQHLEHGPETARVHARVAMAFLQLGEVVKAREACNRALAIDPTDATARWTLGCALVDEGREDEALKTFRAILEDDAGHMGAFTELVRLRTRRSDVKWLHAALRSEVKGFDRLPVDAGEGASPRATTRERVAAVTEALRGADEDGATDVLLECIDLTTDESLRFQLWEAALDHLSARKARELARDLDHPGRIYSAQRGRDVLVLARSLPENLIVQGLQIGDEDLRRAAVDRHGPTRDVADHRRSIDHERREARAWQALLLLALASHGNRSSRSLLLRWSDEADPDLADAARAALVMLGDEGAADALRKRARQRGVGNLVDAMQAQLASTATRMAVRPLAEGEDRTCATCGRRPSDVDHMMAGQQAALCSVCLATIARQRRALESDDPELVCALSGRGAFETAAMYVFEGVPVSREVVDHGLGLLERESVDRWLAAL